MRMTVKTIVAGTLHEYLLKTGRIGSQRKNQVHTALLRQVKSEETCCYSDFSERLPTNANMKNSPVKK